MNKEMKDEIGKNVGADPLHVKHSELKRFNDESMFKSECPACENGILLVERDQKTLTLQEVDRCMLCGQKVIYDDIEDLRAMEGDRGDRVINWMSTGPVCPDCKRPVRIVLDQSFEDYARAMLVIWDGFNSLTQMGVAGPRTVEYLRELEKKAGEMASYYEQLGIGIPKDRPKVGFWRKFVDDFNAAWKRFFG